MKNTAELLLRHRPLVRRLAHQLCARLPANVELDDMVQAGMIGLADAIGRFDDVHGVQFETYATPRIRGAMLDELRACDWMGRGQRRVQRLIDAATRRAQHAQGSEAADRDVAAAMGVTLGEYQALRGAAAGARMLFIEDMGTAAGEVDNYLDRHLADADADPAALLQHAERRAAVVAAIHCLPERDRQVLSMLYEHDMTLKEVGAVLGVTESRACQLRQAIVDKLQVRLRQF